MKIIPMKETKADKAVRRAAMENSGQRLLDAIEGIEDIDEKILALSDDKKARFAGLKSDGYDTKAVRRVIKRRAMSPEAFSAAQELDAVVDTYLAAIGAVDEA